MGVVLVAIRSGIAPHSIRRLFALLALVTLTVAGCVPQRPPATPGGPGARVASPAAITSARATRGDGIYTPLSNVELEQAISRDVVEIDQFLNAVAQGRALPAAEIQTIYEQGKHARIGDQFWSLRQFATSPSRAREFPEDAGFYGSQSFLDDLVLAAITGTGGTASSAPEQRRQAIQKGLLRILRYWSLQGLVAADPKLRAGSVDPASGAPHDVDAAWAVYVGPEVGGQYPYALAGTARALEENFGRVGSIDRPLRTALARAQQAALRNERGEFRDARNEVMARMNAIFYLEAARDLTEMVRAAQAGNSQGASNVQAAGFSAYLAIQPIVAIADPEADRAIVAIFRADPASITVASRDEALDALNHLAGVLGLTPEDLVTPVDFREATPGPAATRTPGTPIPTVPPSPRAASP